MTRSAVRRTRVAALLAALPLLAGACSGPSPQERSGEPPSPTTEESGAGSDGDELVAPELGDGVDGSTDGGAPSFAGRRAVRVGPAVREVSGEPCTANEIERLCGSSAQYELVPDGAPTELVLRRATTSTERGGLSWQVRLVFAASDALPPRPEGRDRTLVLRDEAGVAAEIDEDDRIEGTRVVLTGLRKLDAWGVVERLGGR